MDVRELRTVTSPEYNEQRAEQLFSKAANALKESSQSTTVVKAKKELMNMIFEEMIKRVKDEQSGIIWARIKQHYNFLIEEAIENTNHKVEQLQTKLKEQLETFSKEKQGLIMKIIELEGKIEQSVKGKPINILTARAMNIKQFKELIFDMYNQKVKYDKELENNRQPVQTMEQYMYTYLNKVYGNKKYTIEKASSIIQTLKKCSDSDPDISLFGKILRNECEESFMLTFEQVKTAMENILRDKVKTKHKGKEETEIDKIVKDLQQSELNETYWNYIISKMYNKEHCNILTNIIREANSKNILYSDLQKILLEFQLSAHEEYIKKFTAIFREIDTERIGVISTGELKILLNKMKLPLNKQRIEDLIKKCDPFNSKKVTYSSCVSLFSSVRFK